MNNTKLIIITMLLTLSSVFTAATSSAQSDILADLDRTLDSSQSFVDAHSLNIKGIEDMLLQSDLSLTQRYNICDRLYDEYFAFQFDKAMAMLDERYRLAKAMNNHNLVADVHIDRAMLYTISGMYFEASDILEDDIDTLMLNSKQLIAYYNVQQRFHSDFWHYTTDVEARNRSGQKRVYYRNRILELTPDTDLLHRSITIRKYSERGEWHKADSLNRMVLSTLSSDVHEFAMYAYDQARICEAMELRDEMIEWFARSAITDIRTATKDNASLCSLAQVLLERNDIERAFRYVTISLNDALFYNAKLRPWQISGIMPNIEKAYQEKQRKQSEELKRQEEHSRHLAIIISLLAIALLGICCYMATLVVRLGKNARKIGEMNEHIAGSNNELKTLNDKLEAINVDLREANAVKEEYIALFLSMCSDYIEKLSTYQRNVRRKLSQGKSAELERELSSSSIMDEELQNFYDMFDNAFLNLYPNFVEEFNALLKPDTQIELKRGERLNTELRIFALIRLGICDSSRIAALLRYSVNTIYNYRARTKNNALSNRDTFEERVKTIGK
ncbi:MAG: hypothetical protein IJE99_03905 [Alistipes sp.]|nr:hypothetical protein [Alistipes sp.]